MKVNIKVFLITCFAAIAIAEGCKKPEYSFGKVITPTDITFVANIAGTDDANPNEWCRYRKWAIAIKENNAIIYKIDYG